MAVRNFSMERYWNEIAKENNPRMAFSAENQNDFLLWQEKARTKLIDLIGHFPEKVPLDAEVEFSVEDGDLIRERVVFNSEKNMSVPCIVLKPKSMKSNGDNPAILCCHGHGPLGKDAVSGVIADKEYAQEIDEANYNYAQQLAQAGFLTISPDLRGFGERNDGGNPFPGRDSCNVNYIKGSLLGINTLSMNIWDMMCCIDYLETRDEVNPGRIGMIGLSQGGTMTLFTSAVDARIKAADICGYLNESFRNFAIGRGNFCGSQILPDLFLYFDIPDIAALIAPRPLLAEMGIYDKCFYIQEMLKGFEKTKKAYRIAGAENKIESDIHAHGHAFSGGKVFAFFKQNL